MESVGSLYDILANMPPWLLGGMLIGSYAFILISLRVFLRPALAGALDPLNIVLVTAIVPALVGFFLIPILTHTVSDSFFWICLFLVCWLFVMRVAGKPSSIAFKDEMGFTFPIVLLSLTILFTVLNIVINMVLPGKIPLLMESGAAGRFDATTNSRLLTWLAFGTGSIAGSIYALTEDVRVRSLAVVAAAVQAFAGILFASKGGILITFFLLLQAFFVAQQREDRARSQKLGRILMFACITIGPVIPIYLIAIGVGSNSSVVTTVGLRFLHGLDQLIYVSQFDMFHQKAFGSAVGSSILEYQLMPFVKAAFSEKYVYSNIGQYVLEAATGIYIEGPYTFPNSNLILETVFTSGKYFGLAIFILELSLFYWARVVALRQRITPWIFVLITTTVFSPVGLFGDGQGWVVDTVLIGLVVLLALAITRLWHALAQITQHAAISSRDATP